MDKKEPRTHRRNHLDRQIEEVMHDPYSCARQAPGTGSVSQVRHRVSRRSLQLRIASSYLDSFFQAGTKPHVLPACP